MVQIWSLEASGTKGSDCSIHGFSQLGRNGLKTTTFIAEPMSTTMTNRKFVSKPETQWWKNIRLQKE